MNALDLIPHHTTS